MNIPIDRLILINRFFLYPLKTHYHPLPGHIDGDLTDINPFSKLDRMVTTSYCNMDHTGKVISKGRYFEGVGF